MQIYQDFYLSDEGKSQADKAAKKISNLFSIDKIVSSPLLRARQTAGIVANKLGHKVMISHNIIELS